MNDNIGAHEALDLLYNFNDDAVIKLHFDELTKNPGDVERYRAVLEAARSMASIIMANVPDGAERIHSMVRLEEVVMWAHAGIGRQHGMNNIIMKRRFDQEFAENERLAMEVARRLKKIEQEGPAGF